MSYMDNLNKELEAKQAIKEANEYLENVSEAFTLQAKYRWTQYQEYIKQGFTKSEALVLVCAEINKNQ